MSTETEPTAGMPQPDPALRQLDFLVGRWSMVGNLLGSDEENIKGEASFEWLPGGFFLRQRISLDFAGMAQVEAEEMIGYDPGVGHFKSVVFSNGSPDPLPYEWEVEDGRLKITVTHGPLDATFSGGTEDDPDSFSGSWRPNPGADETINVAYDVRGKRIAG